MNIMDETEGQAMPAPEEKWVPIYTKYITLQFIFYKFKFY